MGPHTGAHLFALRFLSVSRGGRLRPDARKPRRPHTPPRRSTRVFSGLRCRAGGCAGWAAGFPRRRLPRGGLRPHPLTPALSRKGRGGSCLKGGTALTGRRGNLGSSGWGRGGTAPPSTIHSGSWGCVAGRGVVPGGLRGPPAGACPRGGLRPLPLTPALSRKGRGGSCLKGGLPPTPPLDDPLGVLGLRCRAGALVPGGLRGPPRRRLPHVAGCARTPSPPPSPARGEGAGRAREHVAPSKACRPAGVGPPHPRPLPQGARGPEPLGARWPSKRLSIRRGCVGAIRRRRSPALRVGAWGRSPHRKKIRGRVGGPEPRAARSSGMGMSGGRSPHRRDPRAL